MGIITSIKQSFIYLRNILVWLMPLLLFCTVLFIVVYFFKGDLSKYIDLLKVLIWPMTLLIGLFFFRKVVTYMFFSMDEFNFFGAKGDLKGVHQIISEEVDKKFILEKEERSRKEDMGRLEAKLNETSTNAQGNEKLAREIYKIYKDYKQASEEKIQRLNVEIRNLKTRGGQFSGQEPSVVEGQVVSDLGTGEAIGDLEGTQPKHE